MIPEYLKQNLDLFREDEYTIVIDKSKGVHIIETETEGEANLESYFEEDAVIFHYPEKNTLPYGIMNARALAAFLNMEIDEIILETAYRNDWNPRSALQTSTMMRAANSAAEVKAYEKWLGDRVWLELDSEERSFRHDKIKLDASGKGMKVYRKAGEE